MAKATTHPTCTPTNLNIRTRSSTLYANAPILLASILLNFRRRPESHLQLQVSEKLQEFRSCRISVARTDTASEWTASESRSLSNGGRLMTIQGSGSRRLILQLLTSSLAAVLDCVAKQSQRTILIRVHKAACLALPRDLSRWPLCNLCQMPVPGLRT